MKTQDNLVLLGRITLLAICFLCGATKANIIYVESTASGDNNGATWTDVFNSLQNALAIASIDDEIWVAACIYRPDQGIGSMFSQNEEN